MKSERYVLSDKVIEDKSSIQAQYNKLELNREQYLQRARECAELTIPTLIPPKNITKLQNTELHTKVLVQEEL